MTRSNLASAAVHAATFALVATAAGAVVLAHDAKTNPVDIGTVPSEQAPTDIVPMTIAQDYADRNGLTCRAPENAELDDLVLALPTDVAGRVSGSDIVVLDFDQALNSGGKRVNLLACDTP